MPSESDETYLTTPQLQSRWGDCSHMLIERHKDDPDFPKPFQPGGPGAPRLWPLSQIVAYEIAKTIAKTIVTGLAPRSVNKRSKPSNPSSRSVRR
jgi:hypothetical protein